MIQNHHIIHQKKDDGVSGVVSEMLLLAIGIILVAVFSVTLMNVLPGERDEYADIAMKADTAAGTLEFWHKGGDIIDSRNLRILVYRFDNPVQPRNSGILAVFDNTGTESSVFDIGGCCRVSVPGLSGGDQIRLMSETSVIYTGAVQSV